MTSNVIQAGHVLLPTARLISPICTPAAATGLSPILYFLSYFITIMLNYDIYAAVIITKAGAKIS